MQKIGRVAVFLLGFMVSPWVMAEPVAPKVMIVSMFKKETEDWVARLGLDQKIPVAGLSSEFPDVLCNHGGTCLFTTAMGHSNAAASSMALVLAADFDLRKTYFIVAGMAGINPKEGTLGTAAWARFLVDFGLQMEVDSRSVPDAWPSGHFGVHTNSPSKHPPQLRYKTERFELNEDLQNAAYEISRRVELVDSEQAQNFRSQYKYAPANQRPVVTKCDKITSNTWISGTALAKRAEAWTLMLTEKKGRYCTTQQEDNATFEALRRDSVSGRLDISRVAVVRVGSDFDRPFDENTMDTLSNLLDLKAPGGYPIALRNVFLSANAIRQEILDHWIEWEAGVPKMSVLMNRLSSQGYKADKS